MQISFEIEAKREQFSQEVQEKKLIKPNAYIPGQKNGKWSDEQHIKYVAYIDFYKERMRSKQKRRSNEFYKQMSDFIGTRNGLQCRSHHQKLEEKYVYTNKIIAAFKQKFDIEKYREELSKLKKTKVSRPSNKQDIKGDDSLLVSVKHSKDVQIQTDLQGIGFSYLMADQMTVMLYPQIQSFGFDIQGFYYPSNLMLQHHNMINYADIYSTKQEL